MTTSGRRSNRRGGALVVAIALLALGAALLAGTAAVARSVARGTQLAEATLLASSESRVALAEFVAGWSGAEDALAVGGKVDQTFGPRLRGPSATPVTTHLRVMRLSNMRFAVAVDCQVGPDGAILARRRLQLLLERPTAGDSAPPTPIGRWALSDLYE